MAQGRPRRRLHQVTGTAERAVANWRTGHLVAAALTVHDGVEPGVAPAGIRARRPMACPLPHQERDLLAWWNQR